MTAELRPEMQPHPPAGITLPAMRQAHVTMCLGTIFTEAHPAGQTAKYPTVGYTANDPDAAHNAGKAQLARYHAWRYAGFIELMPRRGEQTASTAAPLRIGILMECADPIREPSELAWWADQGVITIGMAWAMGSRYAAGNARPAIDGSAGLTAIGRELVQEMDRLNIVHDLSHLSQRATEDLLELTDAPVIASHSNCRALIDGKNERHLTDDTIREIGRRGGIIGLNLCSPFLIPAELDVARAHVDMARAHIEHICTIHGTTNHVGLGSDIDGGFSTEKLPDGINSVFDLHVLADELRKAKWTEDAINGFQHANWTRFWSEQNHSS